MRTRNGMWFTVARTLLAGAILLTLRNPDLDALRGFELVVVHELTLSHGHRRLGNAGPDLAAHRKGARDPEHLFVSRT